MTEYLFFLNLFMLTRLGYLLRINKNGKFHLCMGISQTLPLIFIFDFSFHLVSLGFLLICAAGAVRIFGMD